MGKLIGSQDDLITELAKRGKFTKSDVKVLFDEFVGLLEELVYENRFSEGEKTKVLMKVRNLGNLYSQRIPARKGKDGQELPETNRVIFRLAENIRFADREEISVDLDNNQES